MYAIVYLVVFYCSQKLQSVQKLYFYKSMTNCNPALAGNEVVFYRRARHLHIFTIYLAADELGAVSLKAIATR